MKLLSSIIIILITIIATSCAHVKEKELTQQEPVAQLECEKPCTEPTILIRDLTVDWNNRTYITGPCPTCDK